MFARLSSRLTGKLASFRRRPRLESLEHRNLLTIFVPADFATIQAAVNAAAASSWSGYYRDRSRNCTSKT